MGFDLYGEKPIQNEFKHQERWDEFRLCLTMNVSQKDLVMSITL